MHKAASTPRAELSGDDVNKRREGREKSSFRHGRVLLLGLLSLPSLVDVNKKREGREKSSFRLGRVLLLGLPSLPPLVDVIGAGKLSSWS